ncbi:hypothetical protein [Deinococcus misasensis]|uniref:hypothetical protein n=1 Tax=Deinococcus misasensis TaxID=392413 RepID=UPI00055389A3|nr:hypothetical protein [Deinococcus misasensis]
MTGPANKTSSGPLLWIVIALLAVGGGGAYYFLTQNQDATVVNPPVVEPTGPDGPVQIGKPLVVKELPFLTTSNRTVIVESDSETTTATGASRRTSNPFIPVSIPVQENASNTSGNPNQVSTSTSTSTFNPPAIPVNTGTIPTQPDFNSGQPIGNIGTGDNVVVLPGTGLPSPTSGNSNSGSNGGSTGNPTTIKPPRVVPLPVPSVAQPKTNSSVAVPEQKSTIISAPTPVLISSLVVPTSKTPPTDTPVAESALIKTATALELAFSSVVIGPNSTAVFNSNKGYLVAATGQKLAGTDILVKAISQQQVTLQLGEETLELTLDRR